MGTGAQRASLSPYGDPEGPHYRDPEGPSNTKKNKCGPGCTYRNLGQKLREIGQNVRIDVGWVAAYVHACAPPSYQHMCLQLQTLDLTGKI